VGQGLALTVLIHVLRRHVADGFVKSLVVLDSRGVQMERDLQVFDFLMVQFLFRFSATGCTV
jgi:hypothetical protein